MPNSKSRRRGLEEKNRRGKQLGERASSFHGRNSGAMAELLVRPRTVPDLLSGSRTASGSSGGGEEVRPPLKLTKLLLNVTIQRSLGAVQVVMSPDLTVGDLIEAAVRQYVKEGRRPMLPTPVPSGFDLHYSQFSLESLGREEKLIALGSRNFFLCPKTSALTTETGGSGSGSGCGHGETCSKQAEKATKMGVPWFKFLF